MHVAEGTVVTYQGDNYLSCFPENYSNISILPVLILI